MRQLGVGDIVNMFDAYGASLGRGIGSMPVASTAPVAGLGDTLPDPTFYLGFSSCPSGYESDGAGNCVTAGPIGPPVPAGYINPTLLLNCPAGQVSNGAGTACVTPAAIYNPTTGLPYTASPAPTAAPGMSNSQKWILGISLGLIVLVLLPAARR